MLSFFPTIDEAISDFITEVSLVSLSAFCIETLPSCISLSVHPLHTDSFTQKKSTK